MGRRIVAGAALVLALLGVPRPCDAGLLEFIWEMSGPQLLGAGYGCFFTLRMKSEECRVGGATLALTQPKAPKVLISLGGAVFGSTGKDSDTQGYDWGEVWMLALEPGVFVRSRQYVEGSRAPQLSHGAGISYDLLFGRDFKRFDKFAFTITPIDLAWKHVAVGVKLRLYPNGFTDDEFKPGPRINQNRPFESTLGFSFSYIIRRCPC